MNLGKDVLRVRIFRTKKTLISDVLMMLNHRLCEPVNQYRMECK